MNIAEMEVKSAITVRSKDAGLNTIFIPVFIPIVEQKYSTSFIKSYPKNLNTSLNKTKSGRLQYRFCGEFRVT